MISQTFAGWQQSSAAVLQQPQPAVQVRPQQQSCHSSNMSDRMLVAVLTPRMGLCSAGQFPHGTWLC